MSFDLINSARRNVGVRLGLWYAFIFACSSVALLGLAYLLLANAIGNKDREVLQARWREYATLYQAGGLRALQNALEREQGSPQTFLVRVANVWNEVLFSNAPDDWWTVSEIPGGLAGVRQSVDVIRIPRTAERDFVVASAMLPDNSLLQVGRTTDSREE
jgi:hypothetical protein